MKSDFELRWPPLERQLQPELNQSGIIHCRVHRAKTRSGDVIYRQTELRVIEQIEELRAEAQSSAFPWQIDLLDGRKICVHEARTENRHAGCISEFPCGRWCEGARIERVA